MAAGPGKTTLELRLRAIPSRLQGPRRLYITSDTPPDELAPFSPFRSILASPLLRYVIAHRRIDSEQITLSRSVWRKEGIARRHRDQGGYDELQGK